MMQKSVYCRSRSAGCWRTSTHEPVGPGTQHFQRSLDAFLLRVLATAFHVGPIRIVETTLNTPDKLLGIVTMILKVITGERTELDLLVKLKLVDEQRNPSAGSDRIPTGRPQREFAFFSLFLMCSTYSGLPSYRTRFARTN